MLPVLPISNSASIRTENGRTDNGEWWMLIHAKKATEADSRGHANASYSVSEVLGDLLMIF